MNEVPQQLILIAGRGDYPLLLARAARKQGVQKISLIAFKGETRRDLLKEADSVKWVHVGRLAALIDAVRNSGARYAVMAGQVSPKNLFCVRMDRMLAALLKSLPMKNAHTIFGALIAEIEKAGVSFVPASCFMQDFMPGPGLLTRRTPDERELKDVAIGHRVIKDTSHLDIGQTVVVKEGMVLAVEAFEGTDRAIRRGGKLGGRGAVVVKVPKRGHDMRFDIPVIGLRTVQSLQKAGASCLAVEAGGAVFLRKEQVVARADALGISITVLNPQD